ncbi:uncharacterized protein [Tiliqua scincoides]|uniref:uncharacterized protein n=1 Tax=Tiliqua scincoides TaxID=71010 RepID=UPI0034618228
MGGSQTSVQEKLEPGDLFRVVTRSDWEELQKDLSRLAEWAAKWQMRFIVNRASGVSSPSFLSALTKNELVKKEPFSEVVRGGTYCTHNKNDQEYKHRPVEIIHDAETLLGKQVGCKPLRKICKNFITWVFPDSEQNEPQAGDLIEIFRGLYNHWGIYVGGGNVVHLTVPGGTSGSSGSASSSFPSVHTKKGLVKKELLSKVVEWGMYRISNKYDEKYGHRPVEEIVRDAEAMVGQEVDYNLFKNNCEHFATWLHHGVPDSEQVEIVEEGLTGNLTEGAVAIAMWFFLATWVKDHIKEIRKKNTTKRNKEDRMKNTINGQTQEANGFWLEIQPEASAL